VASPRHCRYFAEIAAGRLVPMLQSWGFAAMISPEALDILNAMLQVRRQQ
jgi:hypothetical protein